MRLVRLEACSELVWAAELLEPERRVTVIDVDMITATPADDLECLGVTAVRPAVGDLVRLAPQNWSPVAPRRLPGAMTLLGVDADTSTVSHLLPSQQG